MKWWDRWRGAIDRTQAIEARVDASLSVLQAKQRGQEVAGIVARLTAAGERNHFIERLNMHIHRGETQ